MTPQLRISLLYGLFAAIAIVANLTAQASIIHFCSSSHAILLSMIAGTGVGLIVKYILDKRHIFTFKTDNLVQDSKLFFLYSLMGILTTALFWVVEYGFQWIFTAELMRYIGGAIGLTIGYLIKYRLDKKFVFVAKDPDISMGKGMSI